MIRFLKEIYFTSFAIFFKIPWPKDIDFKAGRAIAGITVIQWFVLLGVEWYIEMFLNKKIIFSGYVVIISFFALFFVNQYFLTIRGHGIKFAGEFDSLKKSKKIFLVVSFAVLSVAAIVFGICSAIAHRHFIGVDRS
ncbi:MAG TPA: hypothetical protein VGH42_02540 [Verrucomicrobiae bacterium]|jgi:hypothetical protein